MALKWGAVFPCVQKLSLLCWLGSADPRTPHVSREQAVGLVLAFAIQPPRGDLKCRFG